MSSAELEPLEELLGRHGLVGLDEEPFPNDGWSGAEMRLLRRADGARFVLKRDSLTRDWIARATADRPLLREAWFAARGPRLPWPARNPALGAGWDANADAAVVLMPDLTDVLFDWNATLATDQFDAVLAALASLHGQAWGTTLDGGADYWTPWAERITLICRSSLERPSPAHDAVADRLLPGWDAWDRVATPSARDVVASIDADPGPLLAALGRQPATLLHGDLKLANAGIAADGAVAMVDWQMVMVAPVAIELGWFLVSNVNALPLAPSEVLARYWSLRGLDGSRENDLAVLVGLLLRGWRKGFDAEAGINLASGVSARDDLAWWCERAVEAAERLF